jgi:hypothetical protein
MNLVKVDWCGVDWICVVQKRYRCGALVNAVMNLQVIWNTEKLPSGNTTGGFKSSAQLHKVS